MSQLVQLRIAGYSTIITMHITNIFYLAWHHKQLHTEDEKVLVFKNLDNRFLTTWTFMLQTHYAFFSLICDFIILLKSGKQLYTLPGYIVAFREIIFSAIIWPSTWIVFTVFWGLYNYDRSLIFPEYLDIFLPTVSNHIMHTAIIPIVLFEVMSRPRIEPSSHLRNMAITTLYIGSYLLVMLYTYTERNVWLYPIFGKLFGSVYFLLLLAAIYGLMLAFYLIQWRISNMRYGKEINKSRKIPKRKKIN